MKILILEDSLVRNQWFREVFPYARYCLDVKPAIEEFTNSKDPWDLVLLDHDLGGSQYDDPKNENTGSGLVRWIVQHKPVVKKFIVHSMNVIAGNQMIQDLRRAGYQAEYRPFSRLWQDLEASRQPKRPFVDAPTTTASKVKEGD